MATIIDSLLVTLGLDASKFKEGSKQVGKGLSDTEKEAEKTAKNLQAQGKKAAEFFSQIRNQVIALATTFTAGAGLKSFVENMTTADAAAGRTARNIGVTTETLTAWQGVAERAGGSAAGIAGSMQGLSQQFQQLYLTGQSQIVPWLRTLGVGLTDASGKMRPMQDILLDLSDKFSKMDPQRAQALGRGLGIDEGTINVLMQGRAAITAMLEEQRKINVASKEDAEAAAKRQSAFRTLTQASEQLGRVLLTQLTPALVKLSDWLTTIAQWFQEHPATLTAFAVVMGTVATAVTAALTMMSVKGFLALVASLGKVPPAAAAASTAMEGAAAAGSTSLVTMLSGLAKSAGLLAAAGAVGYAIGTAIWKAVEGTKVGDKIGEFVTVTLAAFGNKEAQDALEIELNAKAGLGQSKVPVNRAGEPHAPTAAASNSAPQPTGAAAASGNAPRGIRNNNPGNLNFVGQEGATKESGPGGRFAVFKTMEEGISALAKQLQRYASRGTDTVEGIISKYAPPGENNTAAYTSSVAKRLGVSANAHLNLQDPAVLRELINAISEVENGKGRLSLSQINAGLALASNRGAPTTLASGPRVDRTLLAGAGASAAVAQNTTNHSSTTNTSSSETKVQIDAVNIKADTPETVAKGLSDAIQRRFALTAQANFSVA